MSRHQRVNPFDQGTPERILFDRYRKAIADAAEAERHAAQQALPNYAKLAE